MTAENIFDSLQRVTENEERSFECRKNIIKALSENKELVDRLELKFIELVDLLLKKASDKADKKELLEIKLLTLNHLYYPSEFLKGNNIDLRSILSEYLRMTDIDDMTQKTAEVLSCYMTDPVCAKEINDNLLSRLSDKNKIGLMLEMIKYGTDIEADIAGHCESISRSDIDRANHMHRLRQRLHILRLVFTVTHPRLYDEIYYSGLSYGWSYESICADWYWTEPKSPSEDNYVTNKIISPKEADILHRIGKVISVVSLSDMDSDTIRKLSELYDEFTAGRQPSYILFDTDKSMS